MGWRQKARWSRVGIKAIASKRGISVNVTISMEPRPRSNIASKDRIPDNQDEIRACPPRACWSTSILHLAFILILHPQPPDVACLVSHASSPLTRHIYLILLILPEPRTFFVRRDATDAEGHKQQDTTRVLPAMEHKTPGVPTTPSPRPRPCSRCAQYRKPRRTPLSRLHCTGGPGIALICPELLLW
jgi:hypothetical protein